MTQLVFMPPMGKLVCERWAAPFAMCAEVAPRYSGISKSNAGIEITPNTTPEDVEKHLKDKWDFYALSSKKTRRLYCFKGVVLYEKIFYSVDLTFYNDKLDDVQFFINYDEAKTIRDYFEYDCKWLKSILGEPTQKGENFVDYIYDKFYISAYHIECDGRQGEDNKLVMRFERI